MSIVDNWQKEEKEVHRFETLTIYRLDGKAMGLTLTANPPAFPFTPTVVNETWTDEACELLVDAGEVKFFEPGDCPTPEELEEWFKRGVITPLEDAF